MSIVWMMVTVGTAIPLHAGIGAHLVAAVAWRVPPTKIVA